jgi:hypothetical protein
VSLETNDPRFHEPGCDGSCGWSEPDGMNNCVVDDYESNDPSWGYSIDEIMDIAGELAPLPTSRFFTPAEVKERFMQIARLQLERGTWP